MPLILELEKLLPPRYENDEDEEEEEALSLCDLPVSKGNEDQAKQEETREGEVDDFDFDFDFGSLIGSIPALESEMCVADEVFSGGQMLPFRHSVSSDVGLTKFRVSNRVSRSVSMDRSRFGSCSSSRSSSTRSHQSNASTSTTTSSNNSSVISTRIKSMGLPNPKPRNQFHSYPSPKAKIGSSSGTRLSTSTMPMPSSSKSTMWQVLRLGLVRTPEIELQSRTNIYIKKSSNKHTSMKINQLSQEKNRVRGNGGFFKSCKCAVGAIEPLPTTTRINGNSSPRRSKSLASQVLNEEHDQEHNKDDKQPRQRKQGMSHHRTFEWLRDLSHPSILNS